MHKISHDFLGGGHWSKAPWNCAREYGSSIRKILISFNFVLRSPRSMIGNTDETSQQTTPAISLSVPSPQSWPILNLTDRDFNQIVNPLAQNW